MPVIAQIPVVLLTARTQYSDRAQFAHLQVLGVIVKPFDPMTLVNQVAGAFGWELS
jgi:DNA-binding response OmpR family regulator